MHQKLESIFGWLYPLLRKIGLGDTVASYTSLLVNMVEMIFFAYLIYMLFRLVLVTFMAVIAKKTKTNFDDLLVSNKTAKYISHLIPLLFVYKSVPIILQNFVYWEGIFGKLIAIYIVFLGLWIIKTILHAFRDHLKTNLPYIVTGKQIGRAHV